PVLQLIEHVIDFVEFPFAGDDADLALARQFDQLTEFSPVPDEASEDRELGEDHVDRLQVRGSAVADDDQRPAFPQHLYSVREGLIVPDQIDDDLRALVLSDLHDLFHRVAPRVDHPMGPHLLGQPELALDDVRRGDGGVCHAPEQLEGDVAKSADAEHNDVTSRGRPTRRLLDRPDRGAPRIRQTPSTIWRSVWHTPAPVTRTITSAGFFRRGVSTSTSLRGLS